MPDPRSGRLLRAYAALACAGCGVLACETRGRDAAPAEAPRIVAIGGAVTEAVFALGAGAQVVAVDGASAYPPAVVALPRVGYQRALSAEGILAHAPTLVVVSHEAGPAAALEQIRAAGVRVVRVPPAQSIDAAADRIAAVAAAIDRPGAALALGVRRAAHAAHARVAPGGARALVIYARGAGAVMVAGADTPAAAMIALAGGCPAVRGITGHRPLSPEVLVEAAPDVIVVPAGGMAALGGVEGLLALPGMAATPAGRGGRIVALEDQLLLGFGPRLPEAITQLSRALRAGSPAPGGCAPRAQSVAASATRAAIAGPP
jgi:iron complex transport system substrate-binding protein